MGLFGGGKKAKKEAVKERIAQYPKPHKVKAYSEAWKSDLERALFDTDVDAVMALYRPLDVIARYYLIQDFSDAFSRPAPVGPELANRWAERLQGSEDPYEKMLLGVMHNGIGWAIRGDGTANTVSPEQRLDFRGHLRGGLNLLLSAGLDLKNTDIVPYLHAQNSAFAIEGGNPTDVSQHWQSIDPFNRIGLETLGFQLDERWFGDFQSQLGLVRWIAQNAPEGSDGLAAVPAIILDRWVYLTDFVGMDEDDADAEVFEDDDYIAVLDLAYNKLFNSGVAVDPRTEARHLNYFAFCFYWGGEDEKAWEIFKRLEGRCYEHVWEHRDDDEGGLQAFEDALKYLVEEVELA